MPDAPGEAGGVDGPPQARVGHHRRVRGRLEHLDVGAEGPHVGARAGRERAGEEDRAAAHFPFQTGLRFSTKALGPSMKSSLFTMRSTAG